MSGHQPTAVPGVEVNSPPLTGLYTSDYDTPPVVTTDVTNGNGDASLPPCNSLLGVTIKRDEIPYIRITSILGEGGFGTVYLGEDLQFFNRPVVVKVSSKGGGAGAEHAALRFAREMEVTARMCFPFAVQSYGRGSHEGQPYLVLERAEGRGLDAFIEGRWKAGIPSGEYTEYVNEVVTLMRNVIEAVQYAHNRGVVHRDLKPSNIVYLPKSVDGKEAAQVKVLDWGIAKLENVAEIATCGERSVDQFSDTLTGAQTALGTVQYMAPEQFLDATSVDGRADVYSLGITLYELLTGYRPFASVVSQNILAIQKAKLGECYPSTVAALQARGIFCDTKLRELDSIIGKCLRPLEPDVSGPNDAGSSFRYRSAGALLTDLERWSRGELVQAHVERNGYTFGDWFGRRLKSFLIVSSGVSALVGVTFGCFFVKERSENERLAAVQKAEADTAQRAIVGRLEKGRTLLDTGRYSDAVIELQKAVEGSEGRFPDLYTEAQLLFKLSVAAAEMSHATRLPGDNFNRYSAKLAGRLQRAKEQSGHALDELENSNYDSVMHSSPFKQRYLELRLEVVLTLVSITDGLERTAALELATKMTARLGRNPDSDLDLEILRRQILFGDAPMLVRRDRGLPALDALLRGKTGLSAMTTWRAAAAYLKLDGTEQARALLVPLVVRDPTFIRALKSMADLCALEKRFDDEVMYLGMASAAMPEEAGLVALHSYGILRKGERETSQPVANAYFDQAYSLAERAILLDPGLHLSYVTQGLILLKRGQFEEGEAKILLAYNLRPDATTATQLAALAFRNNDFAKVLECIRRQPETTCTDMDDAGKLGVIAVRLWTKARAGVRIQGTEPVALENELIDRSIRYLETYIRLGGDIDDLARRFGNTLNPFLAVPDHRRRLGLNKRT